MHNNYYGSKLSGCSLCPHTWSQHLQHDKYPDIFYRTFQLVLWMTCMTGWRTSVRDWTMLRNLSRTTESGDQEQWESVPSLWIMHFPGAWGKKNILVLLIEFATIFLRSLMLQQLLICRNSCIGKISKKYCWARSPIESFVTRCFPGNISAVLRARASVYYQLALCSDSILIDQQF